MALQLSVTDDTGLDITYWKIEGTKMRPFALMDLQHNHEHFIPLNLEDLQDKQE